MDYDKELEHVHWQDLTHVPLPLLLPDAQDQDPRCEGLVSLLVLVGLGGKDPGS